ncbi:MAG TPA: twin-arginine translocase subunit TatC [Geobacterales bacterium]|nr:twin-arginine translocase subunit TatC [Geobacterales bacterium]
MEESRKLSFVEHLIELRRRLTISLVAVTIGMAIGWTLSTQALVIIQRPLSGHTYLTDLKQVSYGWIKQEFPDFYSRYELDKDHGPAVRERKLNYSTPLEPFFIQIKISLILGIILALPVVFYQLWLFVSPGLTRNERRYVIPFVTASTISFCLGVFVFLTFIWPVIINFSLSYEESIAGLQSWFNLSAYVNFCLRLIFLFGFIFEMPVIAFLLARFGMISGRFLASKRRYALLASAIIAAFHADLITMFVVMFALYIMYEVSIWVAYLFARKKEPAAT